ncbi:SDR family NAD(P)-dependent oxidoreductase [Dokdonella sp.]|uniref:SDR family NAD(P)-dependent oxidoreductase n=1 Tax=Dokdonella sp. TaxID=2291710 RepID=UPI003C5FB4CA
MTAIVVGASSGVGRALSVTLAQAGQPLLLVASDLRDLAPLASDLQLRFDVQVRTLSMDLAATADPGTRVIGALKEMPAASALLLPAGMSRQDDEGQLGATAIGQLLAINLHAPMAIAHALLPVLLESRGVIVGFGSIAGARGRSRNVVYAAAKRGLETYFESLRHRYPPNELRVQFHRLGFVSSNLTFGKKLPLPVATPEEVAQAVVRLLPRASFDRHTPRWWSLVSLLVRWMPWFVFRRMKE